MTIQNHLQGSRKKVEQAAKLGKSNGHANAPNKSEQQAKSTKKTAVTPQKQMFDVRDDGVHAIEFDRDGIPRETFICSKLLVTAVTRDHTSNNWGRLLEFADPDGKKKTLAAGMELFAGDGSDLRRFLYNAGLIIAPSRRARELLVSYIQHEIPKARIRNVQRIGWHDNKFVLPDVTFGDDETERIVFQPKEFAEHRFDERGTLAEWRQNIADYCVGNSRLAFAVSCAFAASLLPLTDEQGGVGFHFRGGTSDGKTTTLRVGGSVCGGSSAANGYLESWSATVNGLESVAASHNHTLLCVDEIGQIDPRSVGDAAYLLANGQGKARMTKTINARQRLSWQLIFLSSGEISLAALMMQAGQRVRGGQEVRLVDIPANAGAGFGVFENLHNFQAPEQFARHLETATQNYYGTALRAFLHHLIENQNRIRSMWEEYHQKFKSDILGSGTFAAEVRRVASRFAIIGFAGEQARSITGWTEDAATLAAGQIFKAWLLGRRTTGSSDAENAVRQVRAFIEAHGSSRFQNVSSPDAKIINRIGFKRQDESSQATEYLILPEAFKNEVCFGFDSTMVVKDLVERGWLVRGNDGKNSRPERLPELGLRRVYVLRLPDDV